MNNTDLQIWLSNTAHQREVADLQAAGLNPILSAHGTGASVPDVMSASEGSSGKSSGSSIVSILNKSLNTANSAVKTANTAIKLSGSGWTPFNTNSPLIPLQTLVNESSGNTSSASGLNQEWNQFGSWFYNAANQNNWSLAGTPVTTIIDGARALRRALNKPTSGHPLTDAQWNQLQNSKKASEASRKPFSRNFYNQLLNEAATARSLLRR